MLLGALDAREFQVRQQAVLLSKERQVDCPTLWASRLGTALSDPGTMSLGGALLAHLGPMGLPVGIWHGGQAFGPLAHPGDATA